MICNITGLEFKIDYTFPRDHGKPVVLPHLYAIGVNGLLPYCKRLFNETIKDYSWKVNCYTACRLLFVHSFDEFNGQTIGSIRVTEKGVLTHDQIIKSSVEEVLVELDRAIALSSLIHTQEYQVVEISKKNINIHYFKMITNLVKRDSRLDYSPYFDPENGADEDSIVKCIKHLLNYPNENDIKTMMTIKRLYYSYVKNPLDLVVIVTLDACVEKLGVTEITDTLRFIDIVIPVPITDMDRAIMRFKRVVAKALRAYRKRKGERRTKVRVNTLSAGKLSLDKKAKLILKKAGD